MEYFPTLYLELPLGENPRAGPFWTLEKIGKRLEDWKRALFFSDGNYI